MILDARKIPEINHLLASAGGDGAERLRGGELTLTTTLFLALTHRAASQDGDESKACKIAALGGEPLRAAVECLSRSAEQVSSEPFGAPRFDLYRIGSRSDLLSQEWILFYDRFRRSAANGRKSVMFRSVSGVLGEMGDNVVSHAFVAEDRPCPAIAGFHSEGGVASFCVADRGQGFLSSLRRSIPWSNLASDREALDAVVNEHATSRSGEKAGGGFKQLFKSLLDFNGLVILRSGNCAYTLTNSGETRQAVVRESEWVVGSSVTVVVAERDKPVEQILGNSS